jgi:hypothetical protein
MDPKPLPSPPFDLDDEFFDDGPDEYDPADECGMTADGYCMLAGSEWCDFECPFSR